MKNERRQLTWSTKFKFVQTMKIVMVLSGVWLFPILGHDTELEWLFELLGIMSLLAGGLMACMAYMHLSSEPSKSAHRWMVCTKNNSH